MMESSYMPSAAVTILFLSRI